jgi:hypothetical protein
LLAVQSVVAFAQRPDGFLFSLGLQGTENIVPHAWQTCVRVDEATAKRWRYDHTVVAMK